MVRLSQNLMISIYHFSRELNQGHPKADKSCFDVKSGFITLK